MPVAFILSPKYGSFLSKDVNITLYAYDDNLDTARLKVDETLLALWSQAGTQTFTLSILTVGDGVHKFTLEVLVKAGNRAESTISVIVDNTPPTAEIQQPRDGSFVSGLVLVELRAEDEYFDYMELTVKVSRINGRRNIKYSMEH